MNRWRRDGKRIVPKSTGEILDRHADVVTDTLVKSSCKHTLGVR